MKQLLQGGLIVICLLMVALFSSTLYAQSSETKPVAQTQGTEPAGKTIFLDNKCSMCHSIQVAGITRKVASSKAPDLSTVGSEHNADWIMKWLKKEETVNDKKHQIEFKGKDEDLKTLAAWLESLKKPKGEQKTQ